MKKLIIFTLALFSQIFNEICAKDDLTWHINIDSVVVAQSSLIAGSKQKELKDYVNTNFSLDLFYRGFFINSDNENSVKFLANMEMGYELIFRESFSVDLLFVSSYLQGFNSYSSGRVTDRKIVELDGIDTRKNDASQGIRFSRFLENSVFWIDLSADLLAGYHEGSVIDSQYIYNLQVQNWDLRFGCGATYFSEEMVTYYVAVSESEVTNKRPSYDGAEGYRVNIDAKAVRAINQHFLFRAGLRYEYFSSAFSNSPLYKGEQQVTAWAGIRYVW